MSYDLPKGLPNRQNPQWRAKIREKMKFRHAVLFVSKAKINGLEFFEILYVQQVVTCCTLALF